ncbi:MAG: hypothetical protein V1880_03335 [Patescibacteria group bacterium]
MVVSVVTVHVQVVTITVRIPGVTGFVMRLVRSTTAVATTVQALVYLISSRFTSE